jgi:uncharacterized protein
MPLAWCAKVSEQPKVLSVIVLLAFGSAGAFLCSRLKIPAGVLIGTLAGVSGGSAILGFLGLPSVTAPQEARQTLQIMVGLMVGLQVSRSSLSSGVRSLVPAFLITGAMILTGVAAALVATRLTSVDLATALFAAAPGGIAQMSVIGASLGADGAAIAAVHLARLLLTNAVVVVIFARLEKSRRAQPAPVRPKESEAFSRRLVEPEGMKEMKRFFATALAGVLGGILGLATPVPAGGVIGALFGAAVVRLWKPGPVPVRGSQLVVQALAGGVIGLGVTSDFFDKLADLAGAGGVIVSAHMLMWPVLLGFLGRLHGFNLMTAVFASAPGGMVEAVSSATRAEASTIVVAFVHLVRISASIAVVPSLIVFVFLN